MAKKTLDNITVVIIGFDNLKAKLFPKKAKEKVNNSSSSLLANYKSKI